MVKIITGYEREIETMINEELEKKPNAKLNLSPVPFMTSKGIKICAVIEYDATGAEDGGGNENTEPPDQNGGDKGSEVTADEKSEDKSGEPENTDGKGKKANKS